MDYFFRTITVRRDPDLAILMVFTLADRPEAGFFAVAISTIVSLVFHAERLVQAALIMPRSG